MATYGQVARLAGLAGHARQVGYALRALPGGSPLPWHRVINAAGAVSPRADPSWTMAQRHLLEAEGVEFDAAGHASLRRFQWRPRPHSSTKGRTMGKGDKKSRKGKIWRGSFGKRRPAKKNRKKPNRPAEAKG